MNSGKPKFSIIIPTYNHASFLQKCLMSILAQSITDWEAIVVNNFSKDNTIEIVEGFKDDRIKLINFKNEGIIAASRNKGIQSSQGDIIAFLDSDDIWYPQKLETIDKLFQEADIVYHDLDIYTAKGKESFRKIKCRKLSQSPFIDLMVNGNALANSGVAIKRNIIDQVGGLCEDRALVAAEDTDLWLRISRITNKFKYIPKSLGGYFLWEGNATEVSEKQILRVKELSDRHVSFLSAEDRSRHELLLSYVLGRVKQRMGLLNDALGFLKISMRSSNIKLKFKSAFFISLIIMKPIKTS